MEKYSNKEKELVVKLMELSETTSALNISFGFTDENNRCRRGLVIYNCAPKVIEYLIKEGYMVGITNGRAYITVL